MHNNDISDDDLVADIIASSPWHMNVLRVVMCLNLPDYLVGAGFVRNAVWDYLHGFKPFTPLSDIDVIYFDRARPERERDRAIEHELRLSESGQNWSVRNQARMHLRNQDTPYKSSEDAIAHWLETPTCVAVSLGSGEHIPVVAPYGVGDLLSLIVRPTPSGLKKPSQYRRRIEEKNWASRWPRLTIKMPE